MDYVVITSYIILVLIQPQVLSEAARFLLTRYDKSKPDLERIASSSFSFSTAFDVYVGSFSVLKQVDAVGKRLSSLHSTR